MKTSLFSKHPGKRLFTSVAALIASSSFVLATPQMEPEGPIESADLIQMDIYHDAMMEGADTTVRIEDRIATLTGSARSLAQVERASARAYASPDVLAVVNLLEIAPAESTSALSKVAHEALSTETMLDSSRIEIVSDGSGLVLKGETGSWDEAELAREIVSEIAGVTEVQNKISVDFTSIRTSDQIEGQLLYLVNDDPIFSGLDLKPQFRDGVVTWSGEVGSRGEFERLVRRSYVTGVMDVQTSDLTVNSDLAMEETEDKSYTPSQIVEAIEAILAHDPRIKLSSVAMVEKDGTFILVGSVNDRRQATYAERSARAIPGVVRLSNELEISDSPTFASHTDGMKAASPKLVTRPGR